MMWNKENIDNLITEITESERIDVDRLQYEFDEANKWHYLIVNGNTYEYHETSDVINTLMMIQDNFWS